MDETAPATQVDFAVLAERIGTVEVRLDTLKYEIMDYMDKKTEETKRHFDVVAENLHYDMVGAHKDKISVIDDRSLQNRQRIEKIEAHLAI